jgi:hypothetical protein
MIACLSVSFEFWPVFSDTSPHSPTTLKTNAQRQSVSRSPGAAMLFSLRVGDPPLAERHSAPVQPEIYAQTRTNHVPERIPARPAVACLHAPIQGSNSRQQNDSTWLTGNWLRLSEKAISRTTCTKPHKSAQVCLMSPPQAGCHLNYVPRAIMLESKTCRARP